MSPANWLAFCKLFHLIKSICWQTRELQLWHWLESNKQRQNNIIGICFLRIAVSLYEILSKSCTSWQCIYKKQFFLVINPFKIQILKKIIWDYIPSSTKPCLCLEKQTEKWVQFRLQFSFFLILINKLAFILDLPKSGKKRYLNFSTF